jgi:hypothetical protein
MAEAINSSSEYLLLITDLYKAHSVWSAVVGKAFARGLSIDQIMKAADWSSKDNFLKYYKKEVQVDMAKTLLK